MHDRIMYAVKTKYKEIILYLIFGFGTTIVNWGVYSLSVSIIHTGIFIGNILSWILATVFAFVTNKYWVFESKSWKFEIVAVPFLVYLGMNQQILGVEGMVAKVVVSVAVVLLNYFLSKILIFKKKN